MRTLRPMSPSSSLEADSSAFARSAKEQIGERTDDEGIVSNNFAEH
jgi:hypothetical protein